MQPLYLHLLGAPRIAVGDGAPIAFKSQRALLLMAYLAMERRAHAREALATLLWDDRSQSQAASNLRALLARLPAQVKSYLDISRHAVSFAPGAAVVCDAVAFEQGVGDTVELTALAETLQLYRGPFLEGLFVRESEGLETWLLLTRERLERQAARVLERLAVAALHSRRYATGIGYAERLVALDPLREQSHRLLIRLLGRAGERSAALAAYEALRARLDDAFGVGPTDMTERLITQIRAVDGTIPHRVPRPGLPLVGRETMLAEIGRRLDDPTCRLLTITGLGGSGKTRLALALAHDRRGEYWQGITFVSLAGIGAAGIDTAIATALSLPLDKAPSARRRLCDYLSDKDMLLILDNAEPEAAAVAATARAILEAAPDVQLLVTSRIPLRLRDEWVVPLGGLPLTSPTGQDGRGPAQRLFAAAAARAGIDADRLPATAVEAICRATGGLPLALEIGAGALRQQSAATLAANVAAGLWLEAGERDRPPRHHSLETILQHAWAQLTSHQQAVLAQLALFGGPFDAAAYAVVTGASPMLLDRLVAMTLVVAAPPSGGPAAEDAPGGARYALHEAVREFAQARLAALPDLAAAGGKRHQATYFARFAALATDALFQTPSATIPAIEGLWGNVSAAWRRAIAADAHDAVSSILPAMQAYARSGSRYEAVQTLLQGAIAAWQGRAPASLLARLLLANAMCLLRLGQSDDAALNLDQVTLLFGDSTEAADRAQHALLCGRLALLQGETAAAVPCFERAQRLCAVARDGYYPAEALLGLGRIALRQGHLANAIAHARGAVAASETVGDETGRLLSRRLLATVLERRGDLAGATTLLTENLVQERQRGDLLSQYDTLSGLANLAMHDDDRARARSLYTEALALTRRAGYNLGEAIVLGNLGTIDMAEAAYAAAESNFRQSLAVSRRLGDRVGLAYSHINLANLYLEQERTVPAATHLRRGLAEAKACAHVPAVTAAVAAYGIVAVQQGAFATAARLSAFCDRQPHVGSWPATVAGQLRAALAASPAADRAAPEAAETADWTLTSVANALLAGNPL